jgi:hypothetical protein
LKGSPVRGFLHTLTHQPFFSECLNCYVWKFCKAFAFLKPHKFAEGIYVFKSIRNFKQERVIIMNWKNMSLSQKIATVIAGLAVVVWLIAKVQPKLLPFDPTYPAIAVVTICEAVAYWKTKRTWAYLLIAGTVIFFAAFLLELTL